MSTVLPLALAVSGSACTRPNPGFGEDGGTGTGDTVDTQDDDSDSVSTTMTSSASVSDSMTDPSGDASSESGGMAVCGDGVVEGDEECDKGEDNDDSRTCTSMCRHSRCGDGLVGPGEGCDDANDVDDDECSNACISRNCGNMMLDEDEGEECDPSAPVGNVLCTPACTMNVCGDGFQLGEEDCDDGDADDTNACVAECKLAGCGDGFVWAEMEACDDHNSDNTDACVNCLAASCGDGFVHEGVESCDPEAESSFACTENQFFDGEGACTANCELDLSGCNNCGDGVVDDDEACDEEMGIVQECANAEGWTGEGTLACDSCQLTPIGECCQTAGQPCDPEAPNTTCCGQCNEKTALCQGG